MVFFALAATAPIAVAQTEQELREQQEVRQEQQKQAKEDREAAQVEIDADSGDIEKLVAAIETLLEASDSAEQAVNATKRRLQDAKDQQVRAEQRITELEAEIAETEKLLEQSAVEAFRSYQGPNSEQTALSSDPWQHARSQALRSFANRSTEDLLDDFRGQAAELQALREDALRYVTEVEELLIEEIEIEDEFNRLVAHEERELGKVEDRLERRLAEAQAIEELDANLAAEIRRGEQQIADVIAARERQVRPVTVPNSGPIELASVWGIVVNVLIVEELRGLLVAMEAEGFTLGGGGYRDNSRQTELRRQHCGTSEYAVYQMPASQCSPPTARPGFSQHEVGLAVDFTHNGRIIRSRSSAVFQALTRIAPDYGFINLPSEPWHWSTTGQ